MDTARKYLLRAGLLTVSATANADRFANLGYAGDYYFTLGKSFDPEGETAK